MSAGPAEGWDLTLDKAQMLTHLPQLDGSRAAKEERREGAGRCGGGQGMASLYLMRGSGALEKTWEELRCHRK